MQILIVGGTGTISTPIVEYALGAGHSVTLLNRGNRPLPDGVEHLQVDRNNNEALAQALAGRAFDVTVDMMCFHPAHLENLTRALPRHGHLVFCSTVCAVGFHWRSWPVPETTPCHPASDYGRGKAQAEEWLQEYSRRSGEPFTILRPSTTYSHFTGILRQICLDGFQWLAAIREGRPILIADGGMGMHQFMHADDCGRAIYSVLHNPACFGKTYNVVGPLTSWRVHHENVISLLEKSVPLISVPREAILEAIPGNAIFEEIFQYHGYFAGDAITYDTGFEPAITLEEGLRAVIDQCMALEKIPDSYQPELWERQLLERFS